MFIISEREFNGPLWALDGGAEEIVLTSNEGQEELRKLDDLMARLQRVMKVASADQFGGLTATQAFILRYLDRQGVAKASDLSKEVGLSPGAVTQVCDELVKSQMIERTRSDLDRRVVHIAISDEGRMALEKIRASRTGRMYEIVQLLGQPDADEFIRIMTRVVDIVEESWRHQREKV